MASTVAVVVNTLVMYVAVCWAGYQFHLGELLRLFIGGTSAATEAALSPIYRRLDHFPFEPFCFFFTTNVTAIIAASFWRFAVWRFQLDAPSKPFYKHIRPPAPWYYLFVGIDVTDNADAVVVSAVVPFKDASYIYTGILEDYELTDKGELDRLILSNTSRRRLADDRDPSDSSSPLDNYKYFYQIEGDRFVLRASEYTTLNIKYLVLEDSTVDAASNM
jgi:hypothetical protein